MFAPVPHARPNRQTAAPKACGRLRRLAAVLAAIACGLLASAAAVPAAFAGIPVPGPDGGYGSAGTVPPAAVRVVTVGGMAGWQITLIAIGGALAAAIAAVLLDRALAAHRVMSALSR